MIGLAALLGAAMIRLLARIGFVVILTFAAPARADVVSDWAELQTSLHNKTADPEGAFDAGRVQAYGKVALAIFEAANATDPKYRSYLKLKPAKRGASSEVAISAAARETLLQLYPSEAQTIENAFVLAVADAPRGRAYDDGLATGRMAAAAALAAGGFDPKRRLGIYRPEGMAGKWAPSQVPFPPQAVATRAWFMTSADQFRTPPPVALGSAEWARSLDEVRRLGAKDSKARSPADTLRARFWAFYELDPALRQIASAPGRSLVRNARMYALLAMAGDDFDIVMADGKTAHMFWRPLNAIRSADTDGNDATVADVTWEPLLRTPSQPEYPCGHCSYAGLVATILSAEGPPPSGGYLFTNERMPGMRVTMPTLQAYADAVSLSRIHAGVHYRFTNEMSAPLGRRVAELAMARFAPPISPP